MSEYSYTIIILRQRLGMLQYNPPKETKEHLKIRQNRISQLESAIKRLKEEE